MCAGAQTAIFLSYRLVAAVALEHIARDTGYQDAGRGFEYGGSGYDDHARASRLNGTVNSAATKAKAEQLVGGSRCEISRQSDCRFGLENSSFKDSCLDAVVTLDALLTEEMKTMLWTIIVILVILWLLGFIGGFGGSLIHILIVVAVIILIYNLVSGRRS